MDLYEGTGLKDPWKNLRQNLYRNAEPQVKLIALTTPLEQLAAKGVTSGTIPAYTSRHCWESNVKYTEDPKNNYNLDRQLVGNLVKMGHDTPLQAVNYVFDVEAISKTIQTQWVRHKIGVGWTFRSTRFVTASSNSFVYNTYDYIADEEKVKQLYALDEEINKKAVEIYDKKLALGSTKQDGRKVMPCAFATHCSFFANARAMRHFFNLRLEKKAEWEIRRLAVMLLEESMKYTPEIFSDIYEKYTTENKEKTEPKK